MMKFSRSNGPVAAVLLLAALPLLSQDPRGTVLGRVSDATGALVPNAEIRILNENTGVSSSARTNNSGNFVDRKSTRLNSSHPRLSRMPSSA